MGWTTDRSRSLLFCCLLVIGSGCWGCGPKELPPEFTAPAKNNVFTSANILAKFNAPLDEVYRIGEGDRITIDVWDHPELSGEHVVGPDGRVTLPYAGVLPFAGLSREGAAKAVEETLSHFYPELVATVRIDEYVSNRVFILGRVTNPGVITFETPPTLLEAMTRAGTLPVGGIGADKAALTRCAIFRGRDRIVWISLQNLLNGGNLALNLRLQRNDIVYIPDADDQLVYVLGHVASPGAYHLTPDMTFLDALSRAGGPNQDANIDSIHVIRPQSNVQMKISLDELFDPRYNFNVEMKEGDIVYIPESSLSKVGYVFKHASPITLLIVIGNALAGI